MQARLCSMHTSFWKAVLEAGLKESVRGVRPMRAFRRAIEGSFRVRKWFRRPSRQLLHLVVVYAVYSELVNRSQSDLVRTSRSRSTSRSAQALTSLTSMIECL